MTSMTIEAVKARIDALFQAYNDHDVDAILANFTDDVVWEDPGEPKVLAGREAAERSLRALFKAFPDLHFPKEETEILRSVGGAKAAARWHMIGTMSGPLETLGFEATGKTAELTGMCLYEFRNGLISRHSLFYDTMSLLQQVGLMPDRDSLPIKVAAGVQRVSKRLVDLVHR